MENWLMRVFRISERFSRSFRIISQEVSCGGRVHCRRFQFIASRQAISQVSAVIFVPAVHALFCSNDNKVMASTEVDAASVASIIKHADELYVQNCVDELYAYLKPYTSSTNAEILWRLARATCDKAKSTTDKTQRKDLMYEAFQAAENALQLAGSNFACHKWYAILLDYVGEYEGTKERLSKAFKIKEHFLKAIELNPKDATSVHLLGYWCFIFADMPWYQKKAASVIFTTPPSSSYQEALDNFLQAETIDPGFYSSNLLMIGKTYLRMRQNELAKEYLVKARDYVVRSEDDKKSHKEAVELLQTLGVK